jgi:aspartate/tyrosine/aromatic aminotransferase
MFADLERLAPDPILGVTVAFRADASTSKVDLGVGVYRDSHGRTPVPAAVREAERLVLAGQTTKTYVGPHGNVDFNRRIAELALGPLAGPLDERLATIQTVGGCGALRIGAEIIKAARRDPVVHVSTPTWANHEPLLGSSGLPLQRYPYYDAATHHLEFERMLDALESIPPGNVVLLHGCCHNPTGADLAPAQWQAVTELLLRRSLTPFLDLAYQGLGDDLDRDATGLRTIAARVPEMLLAISCSKNFGLYRERVGALTVLTESAAAAVAVSSHQARTARRMYSMPPDHGAAVAAQVLGDAGLRQAWALELAGMSARIAELRNLLADALGQRRPDLDVGWLRNQKGMFSLLGIEPDRLNVLRERHHVYTPPDGRINVAGVSQANVDYVADGIAPLLT